MTTQESHPSNFTLLEPVERLIGTPFFSDQQLEERVHKDPLSVPENELAVRGLLYGYGVAVLERAMADGELDGTLDEDLWQRLRQTYPDQVSDIRSGLMLADSGLMTPEVHAVKQGLDALPPPPPSRYELREPHYDQLLPWQLTTEGITRLVNIGTSNVQFIARNREVAMQRRNLPGANRRELCYDITFVRQLAEDPRYGLRPHMQEAGIDWDSLQQDAADNRPGREEREARVQDLQIQLLPRHKLGNIPAIREKLPPKTPTPFPELYHVSRTKLMHLMGGDYEAGYHYLTELAAARQISFRLFRRPVGKGPGVAAHVSLEQAAQIFADYQAIPLATDADISLIKAALAADVKRTNNLVDKMTPDEQSAIRSMRAIDPQAKGRVMEHIRRDIVSRAQGELRFVLLPPHLVPVSHLHSLFEGTSASGIRTAAYRRKASMVTLRTAHAPQPQGYLDWQTVVDMSTRTRSGLAADCPPLDLTLLPRGPYETNTDRIAYARRIQTWLLGAEVMAEASIQEPTPIRPPERPPLPILPLVQTELSLHTVKRIGEGANFYRPDKAPPGFEPLRTLDRGTLTLLQAIEFVQSNGGQLITFPDIDGSSMLCVDRLGAQLLSRNTSKVPVDAHTSPSGWLTREQLSANNKLSPYSIDYKLRQLSLRQYAPVLDRLSLPSGSRVSLQHKLPTNPLYVWCARPDGVVVPHYNPAIARFFALTAEE